MQNVVVELLHKRRYLQNVTSDTMSLRRDVFFDTSFFVCSSTFCRRTSEGDSLSCFSFLAY